MRFNVPPNWPRPPEGWAPAPGWEPDPAWGPAPEGWLFWVDDRSRVVRVLSLAGVVVAQYVAAQLLGFWGAFFLGVGNGWELVVIPLGMALGVWGVGVAAERVTGRHSSRRRRGLRLVSTAFGSAIGIVLVLVTPPFGFAQLLLPLLGALLGFHLGPGARAARAKT